MSKLLKPAIVLALISAVAASLLAFVNNVTAPIIYEYENAVLLSALREVAGGKEIGSQTAVNDGYVSNSFELKENGANAGYVLDLVTTGYGGEFKLVAAYDKDGAVTAAKLVSHSETPGMGKRFEEASNIGIFIGFGTDSNPVPESKSDLSAESTAIVSGATITFGGISKALAAGSAYVKAQGGR